METIRHKRYARLVALHKRAREAWLNRQPGPLWRERWLAYTIMARVAAMMRIMETQAARAAS